MTLYHSIATQPKHLGVDYDYDDGLIDIRWVCLEAGRYQFGLYFDSAFDWMFFTGEYMLRLEDTSQMSTGLVILNRNRDGLGYSDPTVSGFGEIVKFDLPFVQATLISETLSALPTSSPTASYEPTGSQLPSLNPSPRISTSPSGEHHSLDLSAFITGSDLQLFHRRCFQKQICLVQCLLIRRALFQPRV